MVLGFGGRYGDIQYFPNLLMVIPFYQVEMYNLLVTRWQQFNAPFYLFYIYLLNIFNRFFSELVFMVGHGYERNPF